MIVYGSKYGEKGLQAEFWYVAQGDDGMEADDRLAASAYRVGQLVAGRELDDGRSRELLTHAAQIALISGEDAAGIIDQAFDKAQAKPRYSTVTVSNTRLITASDWAGLEPPAREWVVPGWIPLGTTTVLYGDGGTGKSLLCQQLATCVAAGQPFLGLDVRQGGVMALLCEDDEPELHRRQAKINAQTGVEPAALSDFRMLTNAGEDSTLFRFQAKGEGKRTEFGERFAAMCEGASLIIVDTAADTFGGHEMDRYQVRQFLTWLNRLAMDNGAAVILLAHPSLTGMASGRGQSGSTAWTNGARSHLYLQHTEKTDDQPASVDHAERTLTRKKANYAARDETIHLAWQDGAFVLSEPPPPKPMKEKAEKITDGAKILLDVVRKATESDGHPSPGGAIPGGVTVTSVTLCQRHFYATGVTGSDKSNSQYQAFKRAREALLAKRLIGVFDDYVWLT